MYGEMGAKSNTMIFADKPGDLNTVLAQAAAVLSSGIGGKGTPGA